MNEVILYKFFYNLLIIISQGIASYYTVIEYLEEIEKTGLKTLISFSFQPSIFIQAIEKLINKHINRKELDSNKLKTLLKDYYEAIEKSDNSSLKSLKNDFLSIQRMVITPTCYYVFPNSKDPGNRVIRQYLDSVDNALRIVFKNDAGGDSNVRWTNILLTEFLKFSLKRGIRLKEKHFKFFCYSQSQFRSLSCWLVTDPEKILEKCGEIKEKTVSKFGARLGQCLTTTTRTIPMNEFNIIKDKDVEEYGFKFSDGVAPMSSDIGKKIAQSLGLDKVPSSFQGRFLGCKGVWTVMGEDFDKRK